MLFRIIYPGKTGRHEDLKTAAREINPTARKDWIGVMSTNEVIEAKVSDVEEGKKLMRHIYRKTGVFPKGYAYVTSGGEIVMRASASSSELKYTLTDINTLLQSTLSTSKTSWTDKTILA